MQQEKKLLNMFNIFCLGIGGAIGSGIFVLMGYGIAYTGRSITLVVIVGCLFMMLAYMYNIVMSSMFMFKGGDYSQKALLFGPMLTGVSGIFTFLVGFAISMYSIGMVDYASIVFPALQDYKKLIAVLVVTLFFASGIRGSKFMATINNIMTVVLMASIVIFVVVGLPQVKPGYFESEGFFTGGVPGFFAAIGIMGWACQGTTGPVAVGAVTKNPKKTIPGGILLVTVALALIYGLMSIVAAGVLPVEEVAGQSLSLVAREIFPYGIFVVFILGGAVFALATSLMATVTALRYPIQQVAEDGWIPAIFKKTTKGGYPYVSQSLFYLFAILPVIFDFSLDAVVSLVMIPTMLLNCYLNYSCIGLVRKYPEQWKSSILHMPFPCLAVMMLLGCACDLIVAYNLFTGMVLKEMIMVIGMMALCVAVAVIRLKTGAVDVKQLEAQKEAIINEAKQEA